MDERSSRHSRKAVSVALFLCFYLTALPLASASTNNLENERADVRRAHPGVGATTKWPHEASGPTDQQISDFIADPNTAIEWRVTTRVSPSVQAASRQPYPMALLQRLAAPKVQCGWAITEYAGTTFNVLSAMLTLRTDWCWNGTKIVGTPLTTHSSRTTSYGRLGGWKVSGSYDGGNGSLGDRYRTQAKADWTVEICVTVVCYGSSGTAVAEHRVNSAGRVTKSQWGWP